MDRIDECHLAKIMANDNYEETNLNKLVDNQTNLTEEQREYILEGLKSVREAFQGRVGLWKGKPVDIKLLPDAKPFWSHPFKIPLAYQRLVRDEIDRLVSICVFSRVEGETNWATPCFIIPKKDGHLRFLTDF